MYLSYDHFCERKFEEKRELPSLFNMSIIKAIREGGVLALGIDPNYIMEATQCLYFIF